MQRSENYVEKGKLHEKMKSKATKTMQRKTA